MCGGGNAFGRRPGWNGHPMGNPQQGTGMGPPNAPQQGQGGGWGAPRRHFRGLEGGPGELQNFYNAWKEGGGHGMQDFRTAWDGRNAPVQPPIPPPVIPQPQPMPLMPNNWGQQVSQWAKDSALPENMRQARIAFMNQMRPGSRGRGRG